MSSQKEDLTRLMLFFGRLPETHVKSLEGFPWIFFNEVSEAKLNYSVETVDKNKPTTFNYEILAPTDKNDQLDKRYKALESAVRTLFWKEIRIEIKFNGVEVYKSE